MFACTLATSAVCEKSKQLVDLTTKEILENGIPLPAPGIISLPKTKTVLEGWFLFWDKAHSMGVDVA